MKSNNYKKTVDISRMIYIDDNIEIISISTLTESEREYMELAIKETNRRRIIQENYNREHNIIPKTIVKEINEVISNEIDETTKEPEKMSKQNISKFHCFFKIKIFCGFFHFIFYFYYKFYLILF